MGINNPLLDLYPAAEHHYKRLIADLPARDITDFLVVLPEFQKTLPFYDPSSSFEADNAIFTDIQKRGPDVYTLGLNFYRGTSWYARNRNSTPPEVDESTDEAHLVVVTRDGPPLLVHNDRFYTTDDPNTNVLPVYLAKGIAEVPGAERVLHLHAALKDLAPEHIEEDWL